MSFSMLCTPSSTTCDCQNSITGEVGSSWAWQDFGIFAPEVDSAAPTRRRRHFQPIPDGTCQLKKRLHEDDDNGVSVSQPTPAKRVKESQENNNNNTCCQLSRSGSSTVSLSEEENNNRSIGGQCGGGGGLSACALRGGGGTDGQSMQDSQTNNISIDQQIATFLIEEASPIKLEEECVRPHPPANDVLSRIASTPFDSDEMRSCYTQNKKGGINATLNNDMIKPLPIIPQNHFIAGSSQRKLTASINKDISTFLLSEAAKIPLEEQNETPPPQNHDNIISSNANGHASLPMRNGTINHKEPPSTNGSLTTNNNASVPIQCSTNNNNNTNDTYDIRLKDVSMANFGEMHDGSVAFLGYRLEEVEVTNRGMMKPGDVIQTIDGKNVAGLPGNAILGILHSITTTTISHLVLVDRKWYNSQHAPKTVTDAQKNYDAAYQLSMSLQTRQRDINHSKTLSNISYIDAEERLTKLKQQFQVAEVLRGMAWGDLKQEENKLKLAEAKKAADAKKAAEAKRKKVSIPIATASDVIESSHVDASKLPVAFAFHLDDKDSKSSAKMAATNWRVKGKKASNSIFIGKNTPSSKGTPESHPHSATRTNAARLVSTEPLGSKYPNWTRKTFERVSGNTAGTKDTYFYSPHQQIKFRAMKGVDIFIRILAEPDVAGDESLAMKLYIGRGYKK